VARGATGGHRGSGRRTGNAGRSLLSLRIRILAVGRLKEEYLRAAEGEYLKRLRPYCQVAIDEVADEAALLRKVPDGAALVALDERGEPITSEELARGVLGVEEQRGGGRPVVFAIGGADGHSPAVRARAKKLLAFGRFTIAHRLVRLLVLEQIYRGYRILRGEPYHRD
jgi:23S rRNA (pseudouridine1915-N3)-methyltransferase